MLPRAFCPWMFACVLATTVLALVPDAADAQDAPMEQRISKRGMEQKMRQQPQGASVPVEITKRGNKMVLQTADASVEVENTEYMAQQVRQLPVEAVITEGATEDSVRLSDLKLQANQRWQELPQAQRARYPRVEAAQRRLGEVSDTALGADATQDDLQQLKLAVDATERQVLVAYSQIPDSQRAEQRVLVEQHAELRRASKSLYGLNRDDRYPPQAYERIYANSRGAFALRVRGQDKPRCSAVLIGEKLALTNNHCILEEIPEEFEAVFDYEDDLQGNHLPSQVFPVAAIPVSTEEERDNLDFVLLELGANADGALPGQRYPVQCLSAQPVRRDDPLYIVGFPLGEPRTVHDNTFVYFPFRATQDEYALLEMLVRQEFESLEAEQQSWIDGKLKEFTDSYQLRTPDDGDPYYEYISVRFGNQPTIGADSDTYHGNSGSPVYNRRTHDVIGLLFDGQEDLSESWAPGWRAHEAILPIRKVIERLDIAAPQWREDPELCIRTTL